MKKLIKIGFATLSLVTLLNADDKGILSRIADNLNPNLYIKNFEIADGTKFKINDEQYAVIVHGSVKCVERFFQDMNKMCTSFENQDNFKFKVALIHFDKLNNENFTEPIFEEWTVKKTDDAMQLLRPNGFSVQLLKKVQ